MGDMGVLGEARIQMGGGQQGALLALLGDSEEAPQA